MEAVVAGGSEQAQVRHPLLSPFNFFFFPYQLRLIFPFFYFHTKMLIMLVGSVSSELE
jgi:hypothetical protein